jgi:hypothetical protein
MMKKWINPWRKESIHGKMRVICVNIVFNGKHILHLKRGDGNYGTFIE